MKQFVKKIKRSVEQFPIIKELRNYYLLRKWKAGKLTFPPHIVKISRIKEYAKKHSIKTFIETGTYLGDMVHAVKNTFTTIYSIELSEAFFKDAVNRFKKNNSIKIFHGDSPDVLLKLLPSLQEPVMFWLDAHYSGGATALSPLGATPIEKELEIIFKFWQQGSVILIDDARLFIGTDNYPTIEQIQKYATSQKHSFEVIDDFLKIS